MNVKEQVQASVEHFEYCLSHLQKKGKIYRCEHPCPLCVKYLEHNCKGCFYKPYETVEYRGCRAFWNTFHPMRGSVKDVIMHIDGIILRGEQGIKALKIALQSLKHFQVTIK